MRFAQIDKQTNIVVNCIVLDNAEQWNDEDYYVIESETAAKGDYYNGEEFVQR